MSLKVWLPLNGDLNNQGLSNLTFSDANTSIETSGKIGSCYYFNGTSSKLFCQEVNWTYPLSICGWFYPMNTAGTTTQYFISYNKDAGGSSGHVIGVGTLNGGSALNIWAGGSSISTNIILTDNVWYHLAVTIDKNKNYKLYVNGEMIKTGTCGENPGANWITIGARSNSASGAGVSASYYFKGKMNDIRIYDECLSQKQIKEIAKGLVCHYKMDNFKDTNIFKQYKDPAGQGQVSLVNGKLITSGENKDTYFKIQTKQALVTDKKYLLKMFVSGLGSSDVWSFGVGHQSSGTSYAGTIKLKNGWNNLLFTCPSGLNSLTEFLIDDSSRPSGPPIMTIEKTELYSCEGAKINDVSGYGYDGTITGEMILNEDSPKYDCSSYFNGSSYLRRTSPSTEIRSVSVWVKWESLPTKSIVFVDYKSRLGLGLYSKGILCSSGDVNSAPFNKSNIAINTWYHFVIVNPDNSNTSTNRKLYINGIEQTALSSSDCFSFNLDNLEIGKRSTTSDSLAGQISDFRMYATALSAEEILTLYKNSGIIDNNGNVYTREFKEV